MTKNIILCSDGTGSTFKQQSSNVSALIRSIDLRERPTHGKLQIAFYDQGVGTNPSLAKDADEYSDSDPGAAMLEVLKEPQSKWWMPSRLAWLGGMVAGYGLRDNVRELARALALHHKPGDSIYLFGFSRGAFTVRAVAGLLHRCGLPRDDKSFDDWFERGFELYKVHRPPEQLKQFKDANSRTVRISFLGLWDTVKSYGGICPISLPHLRHNPSVDTVRHALALDERRAWFHHTSLGTTTEVLHGEPLEDDAGYAAQNVEEVWFRGYHSDIGGGDEEECSARVALLWMLGEAAAFGLRLNDTGEKRFRVKEDLNRRIKTHDKFRWWWNLVGLVPRIELHNDWRPPKRKLAIGARAPRDPMLPKLREQPEQKEVLVHVSALDAVRLPRVRPVQTRSPPEQRQSNRDPREVH